jgi:hypothetical protein
MKIKKSQLQTLVQEIIRETVRVLNEVERGEWWIYPGGDAQFADGNVGDSGHEGYVIEHVSREIYEHFLGDTSVEYVGYLSEHEDELFRSLKFDERLSEEEIEEWEIKGNSTEILIRKLLEDGVYKTEEQASDAVYIAWGSSSKDARDYAMKYLGWKRMDTGGYTSIQTWYLRDSDLSDIKRGIYTAWGDMGDETEEDAEHTVEIEVRSNNRLFTNIPLNVLDKASVRNLISYLRRSMLMREGNYIDYGHDHNSKNRIWAWKDGNLHIKKTDDSGHYGFIHRADFQGRYDSNKKTVSVIDMGSYRSGRNDTDVNNLPDDLVRQLKFEFGDNVRFKAFYEETVDPMVNCIP